jgi:hypothetical protein
MPTPRKAAKKPRAGIEAVPTRDLVRSLRRQLDVEAERRKVEWDAKQAAKRKK